MSIPPSPVDPRALPASISTSEPGSFAQRTFAVRIPAIVQETIELNTFPAEIRKALLDLHAEIVGGRIRPLLEQAPDTGFWNEVSSDKFGRTWLDVPWYWAESYFYRRVLEATRYFRPGPTQGLDPYANSKQGELAPQQAPATLSATFRDLPEDIGHRFPALLYSSLWGNRADLSYRVSANIRRAERLEDERVNLLVDDSNKLFEFLNRNPLRRAAIITDNAGSELLNDLALADFLLEHKWTRELVLHVKPQPFFVSDATMTDVVDALEAMERGDADVRRLAERIRRYQADNRLSAATHWFYASSLFYFQLPQELLQDVAASDLVIVKGDANYRRLLGDAHWPPETPFGQATAYFPTRLVALRTMKAELIVGLQPGEAESLRRIDPDWMVNGKRGVVQVKL